MDLTSNPSYSTQMEDAKPIIRPLIRDMVTMVQELHQKGREIAHEEQIERVLTLGVNPYRVIHREPGDKTPKS